METSPRKNFRLLGYGFEKSYARILVHVGVSSFVTFALMGLTCLFTYMRVSCDYEEELMEKRVKHLANVSDQTARVSFLEGQVKVYRDAITALSKKSKKKSLGFFTATAYDPIGSCKPFDDGMTAELIPAGMGVAAVDPGVIPYGSILYLPDLNRYFLACDTGTAMKRNGGRNIDLLMPKAKSARQFGIQQLEIELIDFSED
jgi:3D (Asp-Asp-Asp) domain-containing protein